MSASAHSPVVSPCRTGAPYPRSPQGCGAQRTAPSWRAEAPLVNGRRSTVRVMTRMYRVLAGVVTGLALLLAVSVPTGRAAAIKTCGTFTHTYHYKVYAQGGVSCKSSLRIVKSFI